MEVQRNIRHTRKQIKKKKELIGTDGTQSWAKWETTEDITGGCSTAMT